MKSSHCPAHQVVNPLVLDQFLVNYFINILQTLQRIITTFISSGYEIFYCDGVIFIKA